MHYVCKVGNAALRELQDGVYEWHSVQDNTKLADGVQDAFLLRKFGKRYNADTIEDLEPYLDDIYRYLRNDCISVRAYSKDFVVYKMGGCSVIRGFRDTDCFVVGVFGLEDFSFYSDYAVYGSITMQNMDALSDVEVVAVRICDIFSLMGGVKFVNNIISWMVSRDYCSVEQLIGMTSNELEESDIVKCIVAQYIVQINAPSEYSLSENGVLRLVLSCLPMYRWVYVYDTLKVGVPHPMVLLRDGEVIELEDDVLYIDINGLVPDNEMKRVSRVFNAWTGADFVKASGLLTKSYTKEELSNFAKGRLLGDKDALDVLAFLNDTSVIDLTEAGVSLLASVVSIHTDVLLDGNPHGCISTLCADFLEKCEKFGLFFNSDDFVTLLYHRMIMDCLHNGRNYLFMKWKFVWESRKKWYVVGEGLK